MSKPVTKTTDDKVNLAQMNERLENAFNDADPKLLELLTKLMSDNAAIRDSISDLRSELQAAHTLADLDPLCPILNRRAFKRELEKEITRADRHKRALSLLFIDLDKFKTINDTQGHDAGDRVLIAMANTLRNAVRKSDIVCRLGGDEFAILLIETDAENAKACALALSDRILKDNVGVTASIGAATWQTGQSADDLMAKADQAMFSHKKRS